MMCCIQERARTHKREVWYCAVDYCETDVWKCIITAFGQSHGLSRILASCPGPLVWLDFTAHGPEFQEGNPSG